MSWATFGLLFYLLRRRFGTVVALTAVILWSVHPAQSFSFASFTGRNDRILGLFVLANLILCDRAFSGERVSRKLLAWALGAAILGSFAKETSLPYLVLSFGWCWLAMGVEAKRVLIQGKLLWLTGAGAFILLMLLKPVISPDLAVPVNLDHWYFAKMGFLLNWSLPGGIPATHLLGVLGMALLAFLFLHRKFPPPVRTGAFLMLFTFIPFPFVWVQRTFLWLASAWLCLIAAGGVQALYTRKRAAGAVAGVLLFAGSFWWGRSAGLDSVAASVAMKLAVEHMQSTQEGPVYLARSVIDEFPALVSLVGSEDLPREALLKNRTYLEQLLRLALGNEEAAILWER